ncbi:MAG: hypothetical protein ABW166_01585 [Sedimenticola sp.]
MEDKSAEKGGKPLAHVSISSLEADVAYFDARLTLLKGEVGTTHQKAQIQAYQGLKEVLSEMLNKLRGLPRKNDT